jgi:hypothetical protein
MLMCFLRTEADGLLFCLRFAFDLLFFRSGFGGDRCETFNAE